MIRTIKHRITHTKPFRAILVAALLIAGLSSRSAALQEANVELSYLPQQLVASARDGEDVSVQLELIIRETNGVSVRLDQMKRTYTTSGGSVVADPVSFIDYSIYAGMEVHEDVTLVIPSSVAMICLGGLISCELTTTVDCSGIDSQGNTITASLDIPVTISSADATATFALGEVTILSPAEGQVIRSNGKNLARAEIAVTGFGSVAGQWVINGEPVESFSHDSMGEGKFTVETRIPAEPGGESTIQVVMNRPEVRESNEVKFILATAEPAAEVESFSAGAFSIENVTSKQDDGKLTRSGNGTAVYEPLGLEIPVTFKGLYIVDANGGAELRGGQILAAMDAPLDRGPLEIRVTNVLITARGTWADGKATLKKSGLSSGIGPIYFYALPLDEKGLKGGAKLEKPQKGAQGGYEAVVDEYELDIRGAAASIVVSGKITKPSEPGWEMPLSISVSLGDNDE